MSKIFGKFGTLFLIFTLFSLSLSFSFVAKADLNQLVQCKESTQFHKRLDNTVKKLENRLKKYQNESIPSQNIKEQIQNTKLRFQKYETEGLLCGKDGLPHLVADGRFSHAKEFVIPGILFIYITGWIGWVGRKYIHYSATTKNPNEKEILIDVPYALKSMTSGFIWPIEAWNDFVTGTLLNSDNNITVSPR